MRKKEELVRCKRRDCFANVRVLSDKEYGLCKILNGSFKYECPFFKTKEEFEYGLKKYGGLRL